MKYLAPTLLTLQSILSICFVTFIPDLKDSVASGLCIVSTISIAIAGFTLLVIGIENHH